jgi:hypothetical protein
MNVRDMRALRLATNTMRFARHRVTSDTIDEALHPETKHGCYWKWEKAVH